GKAAPDAPFRVLHEFRGFTTDDRWLLFTPSAPWTNVRILRVRTTDSPSWVAWREIRVLPAT
ncbi:MAG: hypothetical protein ACM3OO_09375, partial [Planctomycetaceae bacterium]